MGSRGRGGLKTMGVVVIAIVGTALFFMSGGFSMASNAVLPPREVIMGIVVTSPVVYPVNITSVNMTVSSVQILSKAGWSILDSKTHVLELSHLAYNKTYNIGVYTREAGEYSAIRLVLKDVKVGRNATITSLIVPSTYDQGIMVPFTRVVGPGMSVQIAIRPALLVQDMNRGIFSIQSIMGQVIDTGVKK